MKVKYGTFKLLQIIITSFLFVICLLPLCFYENFVSTKIEYPPQFAGFFLGFATLYSFCFISAGEFLIWLKIEEERLQ